MTVLVFGYGSLIFSPELPEKLLDMRPARLEGFRRDFNKESRSRSCDVAESFDAFVDTPARFTRGGRHLSLALGTVAAPGAAMVGMLQRYPAGCRDELLARLDAREGFDPARPAQDNGYLRASITVHPLDGGSPVEALTYLSNPDPANRWYVGPEVDMETRARVLINATARHPDGERDPLARGLDYLEGVRRGLRGVGIVDEALEALAGAVRALPGPWTVRVAPPVRPV